MKRDVEPVIPRPQPRDLPVGPSRRSFATGEILRCAQDDQGEAGANDFDIALQMRERTLTHRSDTDYNPIRLAKAQPLPRWRNRQTR